MNKTEIFEAAIEVTKQYASTGDGTYSTDVLFEKIHAALKKVAQQEGIYSE